MKTYTERTVTKLSDLFTVEITVSHPDGLAVEWDPTVPNHLTPSEWKTYRCARDDILNRYALWLGGSLTVVEV